MHTNLPQVPTGLADSQWARAYGDRLGSLYRVEADVPKDFSALAERIAARCAECDRVLGEIDDLVIL